MNVCLTNAVSTGEPSDEYRELGYSNENSGVEVLSNGTLYIQNVTQTHGGYFLCQARNEIAGLSKLIRLTVNGKCRLK